MDYKARHIRPSPSIPVNVRREAPTTWALELLSPATVGDLGLSGPVGANA